MRAKLPWILFAISLTLNLAIAGTIGWHMWRGEDRMVDRAPVMQAANSLKLDATQREKYIQLRQAARQAIDVMRKNVRPLRRELLTELAKPQPDLNAVDQKIDQIGDEQGKSQKAMVRAFADFFAALTPEQRTEFRKHLRERAGGRLLNAIVNPGEPNDRPGPPAGGRSRDHDAPPPGAPPAISPAPAK